MKKTYVECDRCGSTFGELDYVAPVVRYRGRDEQISLMYSGPQTNHGYVGQPYPPVDLCPSCRKSFTHWFERKAELE